MKQRSFVFNALATKKVSKTQFFWKHFLTFCAGPTFLCNNVRRVNTGNAYTCFQIWHDLWANGEKIPAHLKAKIRHRAPTKALDLTDESNLSFADQLRDAVAFGEAFGHEGVQEEEANEGQQNTDE